MVLVVKVRMEELNVAVPAEHDTLRYTVTLGSGPDGIAEMLILSISLALAYR